jgi:ribosome-associated translation inhibitor RaiA
VQSVDVIFKGEKTQCTCEIEVVAKPLHVVASSDGPDPKSAFDQTLKVVERAIKKQKTRLIDSKRTAGMPERPVTEAEEGGEEEELA